MHMLYDVKKQQSLALAVCTQGDNGMDICLHPLSCFVSQPANTDFVSTQSSF